MNILEKLFKREPLTQGEDDVNNQVGGADEELASQDVADSALKPTNTNLPPDMTQSRHG